jgi:hypothetical protein
MDKKGEKATISTLFAIFYIVLKIYLHCIFLYMEIYYLVPSSTFTILQENLKILNSLCTMDSHRRREREISPP